MAIDQCLEHNDDVIKGCGIAIGLTRNHVGSAKVARITTEFEEHAIREHRDARDTNHLHHDQKPRVQIAFMKNVGALTVLFQKMESPFLENTQDVLVLDTRDIMETTVSETVRKMEYVGDG